MRHTNKVSHKVEIILSASIANAIYNQFIKTLVLFFYPVTPSSLYEGPCHFAIKFKKETSSWSFNKCQLNVFHIMEITLIKLNHFALFEFCWLEYKAKILYILVASKYIVTVAYSTLIQELNKML